jgi:hypothetical protein
MIWHRYSDTHLFELTYSRANLRDCGYLLGQSLRLAADGKLEHANAYRALALQIRETTGRPGWREPCARWLP